MPPARARLRTRTLRRVSSLASVVVSGAIAFSPYIEANAYMLLSQVEEAR